MSAADPTDFVLLGKLQAELDARAAAPEAVDDGGLDVADARGEVLAQRGGRNIRVTVSLRHGLRHGRGRLRQRRVRGLVGGELERVIVARAGGVGGDGFQVWANHASHFRACVFAAGVKAGG